VIRGGSPGQRFTIGRERNPGAKQATMMTRSEFLKMAAACPNRRVRRAMRAFGITEAELDAAIATEQSPRETLEQYLVRS
jgi:hypothetical protein